MAKWGPRPPGMILAGPPVIVTSAVTSIEIASGLNGDADTGYTIEWRLLAGGAGNPELLFRPNGTATTYSRQYLQAVAGTPAYNVGAVGGLGAGNCTNALSASGVTSIFAKTGFIRMSTSPSVFESAAGVAATFSTYSLWTDTSANITSITAVADAASGIGIGSEFLVFKWT